MKISDFRKAMRPKKYLTRDFVVYQDPKMQAARSEMQAGGRTMTVSEKFIEANRKKQASATEAAKNKFMEMKVTKPTPTSYDGKLDVKYSDKTQQETVEKLVQKKFSYPKNSVEGRNIDKYLMDEFDLNSASLERITRVIKNKYELKNPKASKFYTGEKKKLRKIDETRRQKIKELQGARINLPKETGKEFHHVMPLAGKELITDKGVAAINRKMNAELSKYNIELNRNAERIKKLSKQPDSPERRKEIEKINFSNKNIISRAGKELPSQYRGLLGYYEYDTTDLTKPRKKKALDLKKTIGGLEGKEFVFKTASPNEIKNFKKNVVQGINESSPKDLTDFISTLAPGCKLKYADGGRVNYSTGSDCYNRGLEMLKQASQGDKTTAQKVGQSLKQFGKATGKLARFIELPLEIALEGLLIGWDTTFNAKPLDESIKDNGIVLRAIFSDFQTSGEQDRAANIAKQNPQAAKYVEAKEALDKYNELKNTIDTFKDDLASADVYQNAVIKFEEYEKKIEDKLPQYTAILTPGSPEYEAFKEARIGLAKERVEKTYGRAQKMEELLQPFAGTTDVADMQKAKAEKIQGRIEDISSIYNFGPTFEEFKKETLPRLYELSNKKQTPETDAMLEPLLRSQYNKNLKLFSRPQFSKGGLTRRGFLKVIGALTALAAAAKTGIMKITTPTAKKVLKDAPQGTPDWFAPLVEKIMKEGVDESGTIERETVKVLRNPKLDEAGNPMYVESLQKDGTVKKIIDLKKEDVYILRENSDTGEITVSINSADIGAHGDFVDFNMTPQRIEGITDDGNPIIEGGEFTIAESRATGRVTGPDDVDIELDEYITNDLDDAASDWHSVEEFATGKTNKKAQIEKQKRKEQIENDPVGDIEDRGGTMDNYADYFDEDAMKYDFND
jgi:hypothetical protein